MNTLAVFSPMYVPCAEAETRVEVPSRKTGLSEIICADVGERVRREVGVVVPMPKLPKK